MVDQRAGIDIDIAIRCFGEYSYRICDPILFYTNVCGNVGGDYTRDRLDSQLKTELLTALQPAFAKISEQGIRYSALPGHTMEMADALNEVLSGKWRNLRGLEIVSFGVSSVKASEEDEAMLKELQRNAAFMDPTRAAAHLVGAQASAMQAAANNPNAGPAMAFMGMNMAGQMGGMNAQNLYQMGAQQQAAQSAPAPAAPAAAGWTCACGQRGITGKFCPECGKPRPAAAAGWTCSCGAVNKGKFCSECGKPKPAGTPKYKCDKCGWEPEDPTHPPKFCPECGDPFDEGRYRSLIEVFCPRLWRGQSHQRRRSICMAEQITNYKCPACTGPLHFVGASGKLECDYCGSSYSVEEIEAIVRGETELDAALSARIAAIQKEKAALDRAGRSPDGSGRRMRSSGRSTQGRISMKCRPSACSNVIRFRRSIFRGSASSRACSTARSTGRCGCCSCRLLASTC